MNITSTIVTKSAVKQTDLARYELEYSRQNGYLQRVQITILQPIKDENTEMSEEPDYGYIGSIHVENNLYSCSVPVDAPVAEFFAQATLIMQEILADLDITESFPDEPASTQTK